MDVTNFLLDFKKNSLLFIVLSLCLNVISGQRNNRDREYILYLEGRIGQGRDACNSHGLQDIVLTFASGRRETIFTSAPNYQHSNRPFGTIIYPFSYRDRPTSIRFRSRARSSGSGGCRGLDREGNTSYTISEYDCYNRRITNPATNLNDFTILFPRHRGGPANNYANIRIIPKPDIAFTSGTRISDIEQVCVGNSVGLSAGTGYGNTGQTYNWQFFDAINLQTIENPDYRDLIDLIDALERRIVACRNSGPRGEPCRELSSLVAGLNAARRRLRTTPQTIDVGQWTDLPGFNGRSTINLRLSDMYPNATDRLQVISDPILVRMRPICNSPANQLEIASNVLSVQFLPDTPNFATIPFRITQPSCSESNDAGLIFYFDRQLNTNEELTINLIDRTTNQSVGNITNVRRLTRQGTRRYSIAWNRGLANGRYRAEVTGYIRGTRRLTCRILRSGDINITAPPVVTFNVTNIQPESCDGENDGSFTFSNVGGGPATGIYQYAIDGGGWRNIPANNRITGLAPKVNGAPYVVRVSKVSGLNRCEATNNRPVVIGNKTAITHSVPANAITPPSASGRNDARIRINAVNGGTPFITGVRRYYNYRILTTTPNFTGQADQSGFDILNLPAGTHRIRYTDANGCPQEFTLPGINDPQPITFSVRYENPSCSASADGRIFLENIRGGYSPYNFSWTRDGNAYGGNQSSIEGGQATYSVVVMDSRNGRTERTNLSFSNIPDPVAIDNIQIQQMLCYDGSANATITASGGSGNYEYAVWNGSLTNWQSENQIELSYDSNGYEFRVRDANTNACVSSVSQIYNLTRPDEIFIDYDPDQDIINNTVFNGENGSIDITPQGGVPPYTITWERNGSPITNTGNFIEDLPAGDYIASITDDNECDFQSDPIRIAQPEALMATIDITDAIPCFEGEGTLIAIVEGGLLDQTGQYRYQWFVEENGSFDQVDGANSERLENVPAGNYQVQVWDDYTNTRSSTRVLGEPELLTLSLAKTDISCYDGTDGTIELTAQGGTAPYFYSLDGSNFLALTDLNNNTIADLIAEEYSIWLQDSNDCTISEPQTIELTQPEAIDIEETGNQPATTVGGANGSLDITVTLGVPPYTFNWTRENDPLYSATTEDISDLQEGNYTITITDDNDCSMEATFTIRQPEPLMVEISQGDPVLCYGEETGDLYATTRGGYPINSTPDDFEFRWYVEENGVERLLETGNGLTELIDRGAGIYRVEVEDSEGTQNEATLEITQPDDLILELDGDPVHVLCHDAATGAIAINISGGPRDEATGAYYPYTFRWSKQEDPDFEASTEDLENLTAGTYELVVIDENLCTISFEEPIVITQPEAPLEIYDIVAMNLTGYQTNNGSISLEVRGGTPPYRYEWINTDDPLYTASSQDIENLGIGNYELLVTDAHDCTIPLTQELTEPSELVIAIQSISAENGIQCFGEETIVPLTTTTEGGSGAYTYQWYEATDPMTILYDTSDTPTLPAGTYTVVVTDENSNTNRATYEITEPEMLAVTYTVNNVSCYAGNDGSIDISITGGMGLYTIVWSTGATTEDVNDLIEGNYSVTISDENQCQIVVDIEVTEPTETLAIADEDIVPPRGNGLSNGSITVTVSGGTPGYTYLWTDSTGIPLSSTSNVLNTIAAGIYFLTVEDVNNCGLGPIRYEVTEPALLEVDIDSNAIDCFGETGELMVIASGGVSPYTYAWFDQNGDLISEEVSSGAILSGIYSVITTDSNGNENTTPAIDLIQPDLLEITAVTTNDVTCYAGSDGFIEVTVTGGTGSYIYSWSTANTSTNRIEGLIAGDYEVTITDDNNCEVSSGIITINQPSVYDITNVSLVRPSEEGNSDGSLSINIVGGVPPYQYVWTDQNGMDVLTESNVNSTNSSITGLVEGLYTITVTDSTNCPLQDTYNLALPGELLVSVVQTREVSCYGGSDGILEVIPVGGAGGNRFVWYSAADDIAIGTTNPLPGISAGDYYVVVSNAEGIQEQSSVITVAEPDPVTGMLSSDNLSCFEAGDGVINITAIGGNGTYEYRYRSNNESYGTWISFVGNTTELINLTSAMYEVQLRDTNGCFYEDAGTLGVLSVEVTQPDTLLISTVEQNDPTGFGLTNGSIILSVSGGTPQYTYEWSDGTRILPETTNTLSGIGAGSYFVTITDVNQCEFEQSYTLEQPEALTVTISNVNVILCYQDANGSLRAIPAGGNVSSYSYQWYKVGTTVVIGTSQLLENLDSGTYYVVVTDANGNRTQSTNYVLEDPEILQIALNSDFVNCGDQNDWSIRSIATGGTPPYNYVWSNGSTANQIDNLTAGTYSLELTDSRGCSTTQEIILTPPDALIADISHVNPTCYEGCDGTVTLWVEGGTAPYSYQWSNGSTAQNLSALCAGSYEVVITDSKGCSVTQEISLENPEQLLVDLGEDITLCLDQSTTLDATITDPNALYEWTSTNGFTSTDAIIEVDTTGIYEVTVTDSRGCVAMGSIFVETTRDVISANFLASTQVFVGQEFVVVDNSDPFPDRVEWIFPQEAIVSFQDQNYAELHFDIPGTFTITQVTQKGLCEESITKTVTVLEKEFDTTDTITSEEEIKTFVHYSVFPNPTTDGNFTINIELSEVRAVSLKVFNMTNNLELDSRGSEGETTYDFVYNLEGLPSGVYFVLIEVSNGSSRVHKLVIE